MIEFILLDKHFEEIGTISDFDSVIWTRRYYEPGEFELYLKPEKWSFIAAARYICRQENKDSGIVEHIGFEEDGKRIFAKGRMMEAMLDKYIIHKQTTFSGTHEAVVRKMIADFAIAKNTKLTLGGTNGIGTSIQVQCTGGNVMDKAYETAKAVEASVRVTYDYLADTLKADVCCGLDRTESQDTNTLAVFSTAEGSAESPVYDRDITDYKNYAYVAGEGEGSARIIVIVDKRATGEEIREVWIDAKDIQKEDGMTDAAYKAVLKQRGEEKLAELQIVETADIVEGEYNALTYREDFDVGDKCSCRDEETGIEFDARITEAVETYEENAEILDLKFGTDKLNFTQKIIKEVV